MEHVSWSSYPITFTSFNFSQHPWPWKDITLWSFALSFRLCLFLTLHMWRRTNQYKLQLNYYMGTTKIPPARAFPILIARRLVPSFMLLSLPVLLLHSHPFVMLSTSLICFCTTSPTASITILPTSQSQDKIYYFNCLQQRQWLQLDMVVGVSFGPRACPWLVKVNK